MASRPMNSLRGSERRTNYIRLVCDEVTNQPTPRPAPACDGFLGREYKWVDSRYVKIKIPTVESRDENLLTAFDLLAARIQEIRI